MRKLLIFFVLLALLIGSASSQWYQGTAGGNPRAQISIQTIAATESSDDDQLTTATPANNTTHILLTTAKFLAQPDTPRNIIVTPNGSATGSLKITGTDIRGSAITENLTFTTTGVVAGLKAFKTVTQIDGTFTQTTARTLKIGTGNVLGLNNKLPRNTVIAEYVNGARETTAGTVTTNTTVLSLNTIDTYTAPGGYVTVVYYGVTG